MPFKYCFLFMLVPNIQQAFFSPIGVCSFAQYLNCVATSASKIFQWHFMGILSPYIRAQMIMFVLGDTVATQRPTP